MDTVIQPKFTEGQFVFFGSQNVHCQVQRVDKTSIDQEGFRYRYKVVFTNTGIMATKWEWELSQ